MYKCSCCGYVFEEPKKYLERHGLDTGPYEPFLCCPECGGDYEEALVCDVCGVTQYADDLTTYYSTDGKGRQTEINICDDCLSKAITVKSFREKDFEYLPAERMTPIKHYILLNNEVKEAFAQLEDGGDGQA